MLRGVHKKNEEVQTSKVKFFELLELCESLDKCLGSFSTDVVVCGLDRIELDWIGVEGVYR